MENKKRNITPEKAIKILEQHGTFVSLEEAKIVLDLMYKFAKLALSNNLKGINK
nr:hypothetical protein [uncultured Pedobacter sp.]